VTLLLSALSVRIAFSLLASRFGSGLCKSVGLG
jgi:hypothetical protein